MIPATALLFMGLLGSLGHCVGMCTPVTLLLSRPARGAEGGPVRRGWLVLLHLGRLSTYALLGALAGALGHLLSAWRASLQPVQGLVALLLAGVLGYMAGAVAGWVPPLETLWAGWTGRWGQAVRRALARPVSSTLRAYGLGLLWGLLPCGLVYAALLLAATTGHPLWAAGGMLLFGLGTLPVMAGVGWLAVRGDLQQRERWRKAAALLLLLFGVQMALRGLAAWGLVPHFHLGGVMLW